MLKLNIDDDILFDEISNTFGFNQFIEETYSPNVTLPSIDGFNNTSLYMDNKSYMSEEINYINPNKDIKNLFIVNNENSTNIKASRNKEILPEFYSMNKILDKIISDEVKNKLKVAELEKTNEYNYMESLNKIWKKYQKEYDYNYSKNENTEKEKRGRKRKSDRPIKEHNRMTADNIIKRIKIIIMKNIIDFLNQLLKETTKNAKLYRLAYKYSNQLNRAVEFKFLRMKLKELVSLDISPKYVKVKESFNKEIITKIIKKEESVIDETKEKYYNTLMFVLNLTFREWLDLLTGKRNIQDLSSFYKDNGEINFDLIQKNFVGINQILNYFDENENYFARFVFYFYNYERWFYLKVGRIIKKNK